MEQAEKFRVKLSVVGQIAYAGPISKYGPARKPMVLGWAHRHKKNSYLFHVSWDGRKTLDVMHTRYLEIVETE